MLTLNKRLTSREDDKSASIIGEGFRPFELASDEDLKAGSSNFDRISKILPNVEDQFFPYLNLDQPLSPPLLV